MAAAGIRSDCNHTSHTAPLACQPVGSRSCTCCSKPNFSESWMFAVSEADLATTVTWVNILLPQTFLPDTLGICPLPYHSHQHEHGHRFQPAAAAHC